MEALTTPITYGPLIEETRLSAGLDYYKPTMSQLQYEKHRDAEVTFTFKNRGDSRLADYVSADQLQVRLDGIAQKSWTPEEIDYLRSLLRKDGQRVFDENFLEYLSSNSLPPVSVGVNPETDDLHIETTGPWPLVTFWETVVMSEVNETYFEGMVRANGLDIMAIYEKGDELLSEKIGFLKEHPQIKIAEFGTRRRFSLRWQKHVIDRMRAECPENLIGTSNVAFAQSLNLQPIGTFAHEMPMVYAGVADAQAEDIRASHGQMLDDWYERYGDELAIALSDTFGSDFFIEDFTYERALKYRGTRQDSGDPIAYGEKIINHYENLGIDPLTKVIVPSDSLNVHKAARISRALTGRIGTLIFGIGTDLTNDLGLKAPNNVMKATHVRLPKTGEEADLVKLSDDAGKHTGPIEKVREYGKIFSRTTIST